MATYFIRGPFEGFEYDTEAKKDRTLQCLEGLKEDCDTINDLDRLRNVISIVRNLNLRTYA